MDQTKGAILCMFSGGIDSAGVLHQLLTNEQFAANPIIIHHIRIHNRENRAKAESIAVKGILEFYKKNIEKKFLVTESTFDSTGFSGLKAERFPYDMDVCAFYAANATVAKKDIRYVAWGRTKTDVSGGGDFEKRMQRMQDIFDSVWVLEKETKPKFAFPLINFDKEQIWKSLPTAIKNKVWWCRTPIYLANEIKACGRCRTCLEVKTFI